MKSNSFALVRAEEPPPDMMSIIAVVFGLMGLMLKVCCTNSINNYNVFLHLIVSHVCMAICGVLYCIQYSTKNHKTK